jgi:hypothetical protein
MVGGYAGPDDYLHTGIRPGHKNRQKLRGAQRRSLHNGTTCYVAQIVGCVLLIAGHVAGLYVASVAMVLSFAFFISAAWLLITGIHENQA